MPKAYFEPKNLDALFEVFREAQRILQWRGVTDPQQMDLVARRIMDLAYEKMPPWLILGEIMPPPLPEDVGLPITPEATRIRAPELEQENSLCPSAE